MFNCYFLNEPRLAGALDVQPLGITFNMRPSPCPYSLSPWERAGVMALPRSWISGKTLPHPACGHPLPEGEGMFNCYFLNEPRLAGAPCTMV